MRDLVDPLGLLLEHEAILSFVKLINPFSRYCVPRLKGHGADQMFQHLQDKRVIDDKVVKYSYQSIVSWSVLHADKPWKVVLLLLFLIFRRLRRMVCKRVVKALKSALVFGRLLLFHEQGFYTRVIVPIKIRLLLEKILDDTKLVQISDLVFKMLPTCREDIQKSLFCRGYIRERLLTPNFESFHRVQLRLLCLYLGR